MPPAGTGACLLLCQLDAQQLPRPSRSYSAVLPAWPAGQRGEVLLSLTYFLILATVLTNGGGCAYLLERLGLREGAQAHGAAGPPAK